MNPLRYTDHAVSYSSPRHRAYPWGMPLLAFDEIESGKIAWMDCSFSSGPIQGKTIDSLTPPIISFPAFRSWLLYLKVDNWHSGESFLSNLRLLTLTAQATTMPFPVAYTSEMKASTYLTSPRSPAPRPPAMILPVFQKVDEDYNQPQYRRVSWIDNSVRNHLIAMIAEFVGTLMFLFFSFAGAQIAISKPAELAAGCILTSNEAQGKSLDQLLYISVGFGVSLAVNAWIFFRVSGGAFNPAVRIQEPIQQTSAN